jgi:hypothetical protein
MGVRAKRSYAGPAVGGGAISFAAGAGSWGRGAGENRDNWSKLRDNWSVSRTGPNRHGVNWSVWGGQLAQVVDRASRSTGLDRKKPGQLVKTAIVNWPNRTEAN